MISAIIVTLIVIPFLLLVVSGKGDSLLAGYNTATEEERARYNVKRLRGITAVALCLVTISYWLPYILSLSGVDIDKKEAFAYVVIVIFLIVMVAVVLANTWAKR